MQRMNISSKIINYKWEALIRFLGEKERKNTSEGTKSFPSFPMYWANVIHRSAKCVCVWSVMHNLVPRAFPLKGVGHVVPGVVVRPYFTH